MPALTPIAIRFILHWGEMGTRWGINRTVAQIHALLHLADKPTSADTIAGALGVASQLLRELATTEEQPMIRRLACIAAALAKVAQEDRKKEGWGVRWASQGTFCPIGFPRV